MLCCSKIAQHSRGLGEHHKSVEEICVQNGNNYCLHLQLCGFAEAGGMVCVSVQIRHKRKTNWQAKIDPEI